MNVTDRGRRAERCAPRPAAAEQSRENPGAPVRSVGQVKGGRWEAQGYRREAWVPTLTPCAKGKGGSSGMFPIFLAPWGLQAFEQETCRLPASRCAHE